MLVGQHSTWSSNETLLYSKVEGRLSSELPMCAMACVNELMRAHTYTHMYAHAQRQRRKEGQKEGIKSMALGYPTAPSMDLSSQPHSGALPKTWELGKLVCKLPVAHSHFSTPLPY